MHPRSSVHATGRVRAAFTLVELLTAAVITALVATAGTTLICAIGNAASSTKDIRKTQTAGHYALARIGDTIRSARAVGLVTSTSITLWLADRNNDDVLNVNELGAILYDGTTRQITFVSMPSSTDLTAVTLARFSSASQVATLLTGTGNLSVVLAEGVESLTFVGYPDNTNTRIIDTTFTIGTGTDAMTFEIAASPRASADYLFKSAAQAAPLSGSTRIRRAVISRFNGLDAVAMPVP